MAYRLKSWLIGASIAWVWLPFTCAAELKVSYSTIAVREVQSGLKDLGYLNSAPDGVWDKKTSEAVNFFNKDNGIEGSELDENLIVLRKSIVHLKMDSDPNDAHLVVANAVIDPLDQFELSDDGKVLLQTGYNKSFVWDINSRSIVLKAHLNQSVSSLSHDGKYIIMATSDGVYKLFDIQQRRIVSVFNLGPEFKTNKMSILPGNTDVFISGKNGNIFILTLKTGLTRKIGQHGSDSINNDFYNRIAGYTISQSGKLAATVNVIDGKLRVWDLVAGKQTLEAQAFTPNATLAFSAERGTLSDPKSIYFDEENSIIEVWQGNNSKDNRRINLKNGSVSTPDSGYGRFSIDISLGGTYYAFSEYDSKSKSKQKVVLVNRVGNVKLAEFPDALSAVAVDRSGRFLVLAQPAMLADKFEEAKSSRLEILDVRSGTTAPFKSIDTSSIPLRFHVDSSTGNLKFIPAGRAAVNIDNKTGLVTATQFMPQSKIESLRNAREHKSKFIFAHTAVELTHRNGFYYLPKFGLYDLSAIWPIEGNSTGILRRINEADGTIETQTIGFPSTFSSDLELRNVAWNASGSLLAGTIESSNKDAIRLVSLVDVGSKREVLRIPLRPKSSGYVNFLDQFSSKPASVQFLNPGIMGTMSGDAAALAINSSGTRIYAGLSEPFFSAIDVATGREIVTYDTNLPFKKFNPDSLTGPTVSRKDGFPTKDAEIVARGASVPSRLLPVPGTNEVWAVLGGVRFGCCQRMFLSHFNATSSVPDRTIEVPNAYGLASISNDGRLAALTVSRSLAVVMDLNRATIAADVGTSGSKIEALEFSANSDRLYILREDKATEIWSATSGELLTTSYFSEDGRWITITPEGFFASNEGSAAISIVGRGRVFPVDQVYDQLYRPDLVREKLAGDPKGLVKAAAAKINLDAAIGSGAPPSVGFVNPPATVAADTVKLSVDLADQGGGIGKVEWRVNGVTVGLGNRGAGRAEGGAPAPDGKTQRLTQDITLSPGDNTIEVVAYNAKGLVASRPETVKIASTAQVAKGPGTLFVMAVGVNDYYDSRLKLNYAVPDATAIVDGFKAAKGGVYQSVETTLVADAEVTPEKLAAAFDAIGAKAKPQDTFVLFVAGHGKTVDGRYYYLPRDFRYRDEKSFETSGIGQAMFQDWLARVKAQRSVLLFDTCESGSLTEDRIALRGVERAVAMEKMTAAMGRTTIAASSDDKPALEGYQGHGVFTYAILQGFSAADGNRDGKVDVLELIQYLDRAVPDLSDKAFKYRQIPQAKFSGNNFELAAQTAIVPDAAPQNPAASAVPTKPTHVVITPADVLAAAGSGATVTKLEPGALVSVVKTEQGWVLLAREGRQIGFVRESALARMQ